MMLCSTSPEQCLTLPSSASSLLLLVLVDEAPHEAEHADHDPFLGFGFVGAVGLGAGAIFASIPMWVTHYAIRAWQRATAPRDLHYPLPLVAIEGVDAEFAPLLAHGGQPPAEFRLVDNTRLPAGMALDKRSGSISGAPRPGPRGLNDGV